MKGARTILAAAGLTLALAATGCRGLGVPDLKVSLYQGADVLGAQEVTLSQVLAQGKPLVLNFWAGLCPPCRAEMPDLQEVAAAYQDRVVFLGVDVGPYVLLGSRDDGRALLRDLDITYPAGTTFAQDVVRGFQILGMPLTIFINADGKVVRRWTGILTRDKAEELVRELLAS